MGLEIIPQKWVECYEPGGAEWLRKHAPRLCRVWPAAPETLDAVCRDVGVSYKLLVTRIELEQSAITYQWDCSTTAYASASDFVSADALRDWGIVWTSFRDLHKLGYLCGADKTDGGPREGGWFGPEKQLRACALRFASWYRGEPNWLGLREDARFARGVPVTRQGDVIVPDNQASADCLRYTSSMAAQHKLREIGQSWFGEDYAGQEVATMTVSTPTIVEVDLGRWAGNPGQRRSTVGIIVHNTAGSAGEHAPSIHRFHRDGRGWSGIAYHYVVCADGTIERGRPESWNGGHCLDGWNYKSVGIVMTGNFDKAQPTELQYASCVRLVAWLCKRYELSARNVYPHAWKQPSKPTGCPGKHMLERWDKFIRADVAQLLQDGFAPMKYEEMSAEKLPVLRKDDRGDAVVFYQEHLRAQGYTLECDGIFGSQTDALTKAFQESHALAVDGVVGPKTWTAVLDEAPEVDSATDDHGDEPWQVWLRDIGLGRVLELAQNEHMTFGEAMALLFEECGK